MDILTGKNKIAYEKGKEDAKKGKHTNPYKYLPASSQVRAAFWQQGHDEIMKDKKEKQK